MVGGFWAEAASTAAARAWVSSSEADDSFSQGRLRFLGDRGGRILCDGSDSVVDAVDENGGGDRCFWWRGSVVEFDRTAAFSRGSA